jgi:multidrug resistance efflux pump
MQTRSWLLCIFASAVLATTLCFLRLTSPIPAEPGGSSRPSEVQGKTQPAPGHVAAIATQTTQPIREIRVAAGDEVKQDQIVIVLDSEEDQAEVKVKEGELAAARARLALLKEQKHGSDKDQALANLKKAQADLQNAKRTWDRMQTLYKEGSIAEKTYRDARTDYEKAVETERIANDKLSAIIGEHMRHQLDEAEAQVQKAQAEVDKAKAELDNQTLRSRLTGTVTWLRAAPGLVGRPGLVQWAEIVDTRVLEVRCDVSPEHAQGLRAGQAAEIHGPGDARLGGKVRVIGAAADASTGSVPVLIHVDNREHKLRVNVPVRVSFSSESR